MPSNWEALFLISITFVASTINGCFGYGFSSITVPAALLFYTNRILNPALVLVQVVLNGYMLYINRKGLRVIWRRVSPIVVGLIPGIIGGSYILFSLQSGWLKLFTYATLLPLTLLQAAGVRKPIHSEWIVGVPFGAGIGLLYSVTTISGPPLALMFNNQGFVKHEFRAALSFIKLVESGFTAIAYAAVGLVSVGSLQLLFSITPSVALGIPLGAYLISRIQGETFRRICISFDSWLVGFGLARILIELELLASPMAYTILLAVVLVDAYLLYRYFVQFYTVKSQLYFAEDLQTPRYER